MRNKPPKKLVLVIAVILVVLTGATAFVWSKQLGREKAESQTTVQQQEQQAPPSQTYVTYKGQNGKTALELLKLNADVVTKDSAYGPYVDSINGKAGGIEGKYWAFYVNGQMAQVGANDYATKDGDKIEWKFE
jgi:hypothetical protein